MSKIRDNQQLLPSVLDRLIDYDPTTTTEAPMSKSQLLRELKQSVRRDLEFLLNTRWRCTQWPLDMEELDVSLVNYGIPDFTGVNMSQQAEREQLRKVIEQVIQKFEPRFKSVKVQLIPNKNAFDRLLRFRIDALLHADPAPEPVVFDSQLDTAAASFQVRGGM
ncbi:MAG: type VI secretion system baseplate subunit TssE [Planctomycetales bacterium]|nr:type VI secretion system baseplate subunit TssE [Planctomycetales bacterium]